jgi:hypothetical protein
MKVYIVRIQIPYEGTLRMYVYSDEKEAIKHVKEFNKDKDTSLISTDLYAEYLIHDIKDKYEG